MSKAVQIYGLSRIIICNNGYGKSKGNITYGKALDKIKNFIKKKLKIYLKRNIILKLKKFKFPCIITFLIKLRSSAYVKFIVIIWSRIWNPLHLNEIWFLYVKTYTVQPQYNAPQYNKPQYNDFFEIA